MCTPETLLVFKGAGLALELFSQSLKGNRPVLRVGTSGVVLEQNDTCGANYKINLIESI